jgi:hypothetical protein
MRKVLISALVIILIGCWGVAFAQRVVRLGDLPKSDSAVSIYQVFGWQEGSEGYKITYLDTNNEPDHIYIPSQMLDQVRIYTPKANTYHQNFLIIWRKDDRVTRVEWFKPNAVDYKLPIYSLEPFSDRDKEIFTAIVSNEQLILGTDIGGLAPVIRAPGGGD